VASATLSQAISLQHRSNLGEESETVEFREGDKVTVLKEWADSALCKNDGGQLFNIPKQYLKLD
jgi:hypothetical protein